MKSASLKLGVCYCVLFCTSALLWSCGPAPYGGGTLNPTGEAFTLDLGGGVTMELVRIPAGTFKMGSENGSRAEVPVHSVTISRDYYMGVYEVTEAQWYAVMGNDPSWDGGCDNCAYREALWDDARAFVATLSNMTGYSPRLAPRKRPRCVG